MSFRAELSVDNNTYKLRTFYFMVIRDTDIKGRPISQPHWAIVATIDAVNDTTITNWMIDPHKQIDGKLSIFKIDEDSKLKEIEFKKSYCLHLEDRFMFDVSFASCSIVISGPEVHIGSSMLITS